MYHDEQESKFAWVKYVVLGVLAVATFCVTYLALTTRL